MDDKQRPQPEDCTSGNPFSGKRKIVKDHAAHVPYLTQKPSDRSEQPIYKRILPPFARTESANHTAQNRKTKIDGNGKQHRNGKREQPVKQIAPDITEHHEYCNREIPLHFKNTRNRKPSERELDKQYRLDGQSIDHIQANFGSTNLLACLHKHQNQEQQCRYRGNPHRDQPTFPSRSIVLPCRVIHFIVILHTHIGKQTVFECDGMR